MAQNKLARFFLIFLVLTSAAVAVSEDATEDDMDIDRTHFEDPALQEDPVAKDAHSEVETSWILPESPDGKIPIGRTNDLLVALANMGSKMFNVTHIEGELQDAKGSGEVLISLGRTDYGQSLGPKEQRSFRFPMALGAEEKLGEYTLVARVYYMNREKEPFVTLAVNDGAELVPPLPTGDLARMVQIGLGVAGVLVLVVIVVKALFGGASSGSGGAAEKKAARKTAKGEGGSNEWLQGTLAGSENRSPKKTKRG